MSGWRKMKRPSAALVAVAFPVFALCAVSAFASLASVRTLFLRPADRFERKEDEFRRKVVLRAGLAAYWDFDGAVADGWMLDGTGRVQRPRAKFDPVASAPGTILVPGLFGMARRFHGEDDCWLRQERKWHAMPSSFSVTAWVKLKRFPTRQDILATADNGQWGFRVDSGAVFFDVTVTNGVESVSAPLPEFGRWTHLAATCDSVRGELSLFIDGRLAARTAVCGVSPDEWQLAFGSASRRATRDPLHGDVDDAAAWNRVLPPDEVLRIASSGKPISRLYSTRGERRKIAMARLRRDAMLLVSRLAFGAIRFRSPSDRFRPESVSLVLGGDARRALVRGHQRSRKSGGLVPSACKTVPGILSIRGVSVPCAVSLFGASTCYPDCERMSFSIVPAERGATLPDGSRRLVLCAPECGGWATPLAESLVSETTGLAVAPQCRTVSLRFDGRDVGVYLCRDFSLAGASAARRPDLPPSMVKFHGQSLLCTFSERIRTSPDDLSDPICALLGSCFDSAGAERLKERVAQRFSAVLDDPHCPVPRPLRLLGLRRTLDRIGVAVSAGCAASDVPLSPQMLTGRNLSPFRVCEDLDFSTFRAALPPRASVTFRSLSPHLLSDGGQLVGIPSAVPEKAVIEVGLRMPDGTSSTRLLEFRVMPATMTVPAVFVWCDGAVDKIRRTDAAISFVREGPVDNVSGGVLHGTIAGGGGIKWRGNTSYFSSDKKLLSIKTDLPHGFFGSGATRVLLCMNAGYDVTHCCNKLAMDLFRAMPQPPGRAANAAPRFVSAEVFLNGEYYGLFDLAERIDSDLEGLQPEDVVFRHSKVAPHRPRIRATRPRPKHGDFDAPARLAMSLAAEPAGSPDWADRARSAIDVESLADLQLLTNLFGNGNGFLSGIEFDEMPIYRPSTGRIRFVPWDFDTVLGDCTDWISFPLDTAFFERDPDFRHAIAERWRELRAGPWRQDILEERFRAVFEGVLPALATDLERWGLSVGDPSEEALRSLCEAKIKALRIRATVIDAKLSGME